MYECEYINLNKFSLVNAAKKTVAATMANAPKPEACLSFWDFGDRNRWIGHRRDVTDETSEHWTEARPQVATPPPTWLATVVMSRIFSRKKHMSCPLLSTSHLFWERFYQHQCVARPRPSTLASCLFKHE